MIHNRLSPRARTFTNHVLSTSQNRTKAYPILVGHVLATSAILPPEGEDIDIFFTKTVAPSLTDIMDKINVVTPFDFRGAAQHVQNFYNWRANVARGTLLIAMSDSIPEYLSGINSYLTDDDIKALVAGKDEPEDALLILHKNIFELVSSLTEEEGDDS